MEIRDILLALVVVMIWGVNFVVIQIGLVGLPPVLFTTLRFVFAAIPLVFFIRRPSVPWRLLIGFGLAQFAIQFTLLFVGMKLGMSAGLASLVIQLQVFFTIGLAIVVLGEHPRAQQLTGAGLALGGIVLVAANIESHATLIGFAMVVAAGFSWSCANIIAKRIGPVDVLALVIWGSLIAVPPLIVATLALEGWTTAHAALVAMDWKAWATVLFQAYPNTLFGFAAWSTLMRRYPAALIAPFALLVPVAGMLSAAIVLHEPMQWWKIVAGLLVLGGLAMTQRRAAK